MGLVPGFVFQVNRRALLAVLAVGISVSYALVAGAAVGGLNEAQTALAGDLSDTVLVASDPEDETFGLDEIDPAPDHGLATHEADAGTFYTVRGGEAPVDNASKALAARTGPWEAGENVTIAGENRTVVHGELPRGAAADWLGVTERVFVAAGGPSEGVHLAIYEDTGDELASRLEDQGFDVQEAPAAFPFYTKGSLELVSAVSVTVVASAFVVALLTSTVVSLELNAKRSSFATLQVYAGSGLVRRLVAGRGAAILAAGHAVGVGVTLGALFLVGRAGGPALALPAGYVATATTATFGGGLLGLAVPVYRAGQPLTAGELGEADSPPDLPSPLRLTLASWRTVVPLAVSAMVLAGSLGVVFGAVDMPSQLFGTDDANVLADTSNNPLRGTAPAFLGTHLGKVDGFQASSPEIYAPTTVQGKPVMVRGVVWENIVAIDSVHLEEGNPPEAPGEAVLGERLAGKLDASVGDRYKVPASYSANVQRVQVVGIAEAPGLLGDEMLVPLDTARGLTGLGPDEVNIVRYRTDPDFTLNGTLRDATPTGIEATGLSVTPERPIPLQTATARVELVNFAPSENSRQLTLRVNGEAVADRHVTLDGHSTGTAELPFRVPDAGLLDLRVNPREEVETGEPAYALDLPDLVTNDTDFDATVTHKDDGDPAEGVTVRLGEASAVTDASGNARLHAVGIGNRTVTADGPDGQGADTLVVVEPGDQHRSRLVYPEVNGPQDLDSGQTWSGSAIVENVGGEAFDGVAEIPVDGEPRNTSEIRLLSGERGRVEFSLELDDGRHRIGQGSGALTVTVGEVASEPPAGGDGGGNETDADGGGGQDGTGGDGGDGSDGADGTDGGEGSGDGQQATGGDDIRELLRQRAQGGSSDGSGGSVKEELDAMEAFLADTFENFNAAVTVVTIATVLHAGLIGLVAVRRDVEENADNLATLATVGADRRLLRRRALREFALVGGVATVLGVVGGLALVAAAANLGWIGGFGHALVPRTSLGFALRLAAVSMAVILGSAVLAVEQVRGRSIGDLLREGPTRSKRPPLSTLIGGER